MGGDLGGDEGGEEAVLGGLGTVRDQVDGEILDDPAADNGVVGHDEGGNQEGQITQKTPLLMQSPEGVQCVLLGPAADGHVRGQQCEAEGQHQYQIDKQKKSAAVFCSQIRETPQITDTYSTAGSRQHKPDLSGKAAFFLFHDK